MTERPEISVVMGVYNGARDLAETMESILSQEGVDFEFVVVNDGSTDDTASVLEGYARCDRRVRIVHQENGGLTSALIRGCAEATGEFIARQDVGDLSRPGRLREQLARLRARPDCAFVSCWTDMIGPRGEFLFTVKGSGLAAVPIDILSPETEWGHVDGPTSHPSVVFRAAAYHSCGGYRAPFHFGQDWDLWYRLAALGKFQMVEQRLCACRVTVGSISAARKQEQEAFARLSHKAFLQRHRGQSDAAVLEEARLLKQSARAKDSKVQHGAAANNFIGRCLLRNRDKAAIRYLSSAAKAEPFKVQRWLSLMRALTLFIPRFSI